MTFSQILLMLAIQAIIFLMLCHGAYEVTTRRGRFCYYTALTWLFAISVIDVKVILNWIESL